MKEFSATKDVTVGEDRYRLSRMTPQAGSWVVMQLLSKALLGGAAGNVSPENLAAVLPMVFQQFTEDEFRSLQAKCFAVCSRYVSVDGTAVPQPLLMQDGRWAVREPDLVTALALTVNALVFNLEPFFDEGALEILKRSMPDLSRSKAPSSMDTSGAR